MQTEAQYRPWAALWSLVVGFFMILVDATIVMIALPEIMAGLGTDLTGGMWVTSSYLLAYVVPLLITGRLGDVVGPKRMYLIGLTVFTLSSLACGLSTTPAAMVVARAAQGLGASFMTPQTMTAITRMFPGEKRGPAMAVWGATSGVAMLVGPILGGFLTGALGWSWIFFINVPVGILGFVLVVRNVPRFDLHAHNLDWVGVVLSAVAMFLLVFGIQEGETFDWNSTVWTMIAAGVVVMAVFTAWQFRVKEPLIPPALFTDRNFTLSNVAIACMGFAVTGMTLPFILYLQNVRDFTPLNAALMLVPMAVAALLMAWPIGRLVGIIDPKWLAAGGMALTAASLVGMWLLIHPDRPLWQFVFPTFLTGFGSAFVWSPLVLSATYNLVPSMAGAGSGVYNATRQVGSVLGSAGIAAMMVSRVSAEFGSSGHASAQGTMPGLLHDPFSRAMGTSLLLPAAALAVGALVCVCFVPIQRKHVSPDRSAPARDAGASRAPGDG